MTRTEAAMAAKNETVRVTINGSVHAVPRGATILEACRSGGVFVPTFCHAPEFEEAGFCRICVVEIKGRHNLPASCVTEVAEGMDVQTDSAAVTQARRTVLELLLANHPPDCLTCEKSGECPLQDYAYRYGVDMHRWAGARRRHPVDDANPFIVRDMNKCILCGRCVQACAQVQGDDILDFAARGFATRIIAGMDEPLGESGCVLCGNCVAYCPTAALTEKLMRGRGRRWEVQKTRTVCPYCGVGCTMDLNVKDGRVIGVTSSPGGVNGLALCVKGRFGHQFIHHPDRLRCPLVRWEKGGPLEETTWDEALAVVARRFGEIRAAHGPDAFGVIASARCTNEENFALSRFARAVLGTNNIDHCARL